MPSAVKAARARPPCVEGVEALYTIACALLTTLGWARRKEARMQSQGDSICQVVTERGRAVQDRSRDAG